MNNHQNDSVKIVLLVVILCLLGYFIVTQFANRGVGQTGQIFDDSRAAKLSCGPKPPNDQNTCVYPRFYMCFEGTWHCAEYAHTDSGATNGSTQ